MDILIISKIGKSQTVKNANQVPAVGEQVDAFYRPWPTVQAVLWYPQKSTLEEYGFKEFKDAIVFVD